ncbi:MAG TPA: hypothetical protein VLL05_03900 [Terriglobales bacterium]|nr:hypothetical protein [Terriglobales bacterium]
MDRLRLISGGNLLHLDVNGLPRLSRRGLSNFAAPNHVCGHEHFIAASERQESIINFPRWAHLDGQGCHGEQRQQRNGESQPPMPLHKEQAG